MAVKTAFDQVAYSASESVAILSLSSSSSSCHRPLSSLGIYQEYRSDPSGGGPANAGNTVVALIAKTSADATLRRTLPLGILHSFCCLNFMSSPFPAKQTFATTTKDIISPSFGKVNHFCQDSLHFINLFLRLSCVYLSIFCVFCIKPVFFSCLKCHCSSGALYIILFAVIVYLLKNHEAFLFQNIMF